MFGFFPKDRLQLATVNNQIALHMSLLRFIDQLFLEQFSFPKIIFSDHIYNVYSYLSFLEFIFKVHL